MIVAEAYVTLTSTIDAAADAPELCDNIANEVGGTLLSCDVEGTADRKLEESSLLHTKVQVADENRAREVTDNAQSFLERASAACGIASTFISAVHAVDNNTSVTFVYNKNIIHTPCGGALSAIDFSFFYFESISATARGK